MEKVSSSLAVLVEKSRKKAENANLLAEAFPLFPCLVTWCSKLSFILLMVGCGSGFSPKMAVTGMMRTQPYNGRMRIRIQSQNGMMGIGDVHLEIHMHIRQIWTMNPIYRVFIKNLGKYQIPTLAGKQSVSLKWCHLLPYPSPFWYLVSKKFHNHSVIINLERLLRCKTVKIVKTHWKLKYL